MTKMGFPKYLTDLVSKLYKDQESADRTGIGNQSGSALEGDSDRGVFCHEVFSMSTQSTHCQENSNIPELPFLSCLTP